MVLKRYTCPILTFELHKGLLYPGLVVEEGSGTEDKDH